MAIKKPFNAVLDTAEPLKFLENVFDFVDKETDLLKNIIIHDQSVEVNGLLVTIRSSSSVKDPKFCPPENTTYCQQQHPFSQNQSLGMDPAATNDKSASAPENLSKNARKKLLKEEERRRKKEEKERKFSVMPKSTLSVQEKDPTKFRENRLQLLDAQKAAGMNPYPHKFQASMSISKFIDKYKSLNAEDRLKDVQVSLTGRLMNDGRSSSKGLIFYDLLGDGGKVQVMAAEENSDLDEAGFSNYHSSVKRFDIVGITGFPGKTRAGELSIIAKSFTSLSYCNYQLKVNNPLTRSIDLTHQDYPTNYEKL